MRTDNPTWNCQPSLEMEHTILCSLSVSLLCVCLSLTLTSKYTHIWTLNLVLLSESLTKAISHGCTSYFLFILFRNRQTPHKLYMVEESYHSLLFWKEGASWSLIRIFLFFPECPKFLHIAPGIGTCWTTHLPGVWNQNMQQLASGGACSGGLIVLLFHTPFQNGWNDKASVFVEKGYLCNQYLLCISNFI